MTILAIDIGNTRAKLGIWNTANPTGQAADLLTAVPLTAQVDLPAEVKLWLEVAGCSDVQQIVIAGSNPRPVDELMGSWLSQEFQITAIRSFKQIPLTMDVETPETVGIDRLLTAVAVRSRQQQHTPVIVVDAGTATTVNLTTADGKFRGGAILPGMRMAARALHNYTAVLPLIDADALFGIGQSDQTTESISRNVGTKSQPALQMPGRNTTAAIQNGIFWGHLGSIKELIAQLASSLQSSDTETSNLKVVVTGGGGRQLATLISNATYEDSLALTGLSTLATGTKS